MRNYRIRERRERLGLSQADFASLSGCPHFRQASVSAAELHPDSNPGSRDRCRRILIKLWRDARDRRLEAARIARHRALWDAIPAGPEKAALERALIRQAVALLDQGNGDAFDAICEFLPDDPVNAAAGAWLDGIGNAATAPQPAPQGGVPSEDAGKAVPALGAA